MRGMNRPSTTTVHRGAWPNPCLGFQGSMILFIHPPSALSMGLCGLVLFSPLQLPQALLCAAPAREYIKRIE